MIDFIIRKKKQNEIGVKIYIFLFLDHRQYASINRFKYNIVLPIKRIKYPKYLFSSSDFFILPDICCKFKKHFLSDIDFQRFFIIPLFTFYCTCVFDYLFNSICIFPIAIINNSVKRFI